MGELDVILRPQDRSAWRFDIYKGRVIDRELNVNKFHIFLATIRESTIDNGKKNQGVCRVSCGCHDVALCVVKASDRKLRKIKPTVVEESEPIIDGAVHSRDEVELSTKGNQLESKVDVLGGEGGLVIMKGVRSLMGKHRRIDDGI